MKIKIAKYYKHNFNNEIQIEVKMTLIGFLFRNSWTVVQGDFKNTYNKWIPCYMDLKKLLFK